MNTRIGILRMLERGPAIGDDIAEAIGGNRNTVGVWLSRLKSYGVLAAEPVPSDKRGPPVLLYRLA